MSAITAKASRKMKKYAVLTREPRCFLGSFDFSWEQRKFEEIAVRSSVICSDANLPRVEYEDIVSGTGRLNKDIYAKESSKSGIAFHQGDVLYGKLRPYLQNWLLPAFDGLAVGDFWVLQPQNADSSFLYRLIQSRQFDEVANQSTGTKMPRADWKLVSKTMFSIPSNICEQAAIGTYFTALDYLITLHQRKCALLFSSFQALISMMFTTSTFSWEQRKLGELALFNPKDELPQTFEYVDLESVVGTEMLSHRTEAKSSAPSRAQRLAHTGDLFYQTVRPYQRNNYLFEKPDNNYVFSTGYAQMRPYVDGYFLLSLVQSDRFVKVVLDNCTGTSYPAINANDLAEIEVSAPLDENEAQKIGTIFRNIDNLITLHQRELEKLQNIKKSMLEKMFV